MPCLHRLGRLLHTPRAVVRGNQVNCRSKYTAIFFAAGFVLLTVLLCFARESRAQQSLPPAATPSPATAQAPAGQVQGYTLTPGEEAKAIAYAHARHELYFLD